MVGCEESPLLAAAAAAAAAVVAAITGTSYKHSANSITNPNPMSSQ
jgi:hypothetical protein